MEEIMEADKCLEHKPTQIFRQYIMLSGDIIKWKPVTELKGKFRNWKTIPSYLLI